MKHIILYIFICVIAGFMVFLINKNRDQISPKLLSVETYYSYLDQIDEKAYIDFYINTQDHPIVKKDSYEKLLLHSLDYNKSVTLELETIIFLHQESYLNESYYKYSFSFIMPLLGYDFDIEDAYLEMILINEELYDIYIGSISFKTIEDVDDSQINWTALSGRKAEGQYLSRLSYIDIEYDKIDQAIKDISVGNLYDITYEVLNNVITLTIPYDAKLFYACPIMIQFDDDAVNTINYFVYIKDFETLKQSGQLIYHYALN